MLWLYQRTMFGKIENAKNESLPDVGTRELVLFVPLLILAVWIGLYPSPFLRRLDTSVSRVIARVSPQYVQQQNAADCTTPEPAAPVAVVASLQFTTAPCTDGTPRQEGQR
jgi:NADH-quinone oxidoreductase subunit M